MSSTITNLRINNLPATGVVRITDDRPVVTWEFNGEAVATPSIPPVTIASVTSFKQASFEVRLGTSSANLGTSSFVGDLVATGAVVSEDTFWRYTGFDLSRSGTYYGQVRVTDEFGGNTAWKTFTVKYNALPVAFGVSITPSTPASGNRLTAAWSYIDADSDAEGATRIVWLRNSIHERWLDDRTTVPESYVKAGDVWTLLITPNDGWEQGLTVSSTPVTIKSTATVPQVSRPNLIPRDPTTLDVLYADFASDRPDEVSVKWYVNGTLLNASTRMLRTTLSVGDRVHFELIPGAGNPPIVSDEIAVSAPVPRITNLRVERERDNLAVTLENPQVTWDVIYPQGSTFHLRVGTTPEAGDIFEGDVLAPDNRFAIPKGLLKGGSDYWVHVIHPGATFGGDSAHFRMSGSLWESSVSNTTGWTIEANVAVEESGQGIRLSDGTRFAEVRLSTTGLSVISRGTTAATVSLGDGKPHAITLVGVGNNLSVYVDQQLAVDAVMGQASVDKYVEFGATGGGKATWRSFNYTVTGAIHPSNAAYEDYTYTTAITSRSSKGTAMSTLGHDVLYATASMAGDAEVLAYRATAQPETWPAVSKSFSPVSRIVGSPDGSYTYFPHANGATFIQSHPVVKYDSIADLSQDGADWNGWLQVDDVDGATRTGGGLKIETTKLAGKSYLSQMYHGSPWFDRVDSNRGWTVDFSMSLDVISAVSAVDIGARDMVGLLVNDGKYGEAIHLTGDGLTLKSSGVTAALGEEYWSTAGVYSGDFRVEGKDRRIRVWARPNASVEFKLVAQGNSLWHSSPEGNAIYPDLTQDGSGNWHAVWQDDGVRGSSQILYSKRTSSVWSEPAVIVDPSRNASRPRIAAVDGRIFVVFEQRYAEQCTIGLVILGEDGWSDPSSLSGSGNEARNPSVAVNATDLFVAWEDVRPAGSVITLARRFGASGQWDTPVQLGTATKACSSPALDATTSSLVVTWSESGASVRKVYGKVRNLSTGAWTATTNLSQNTVGDAGSPDVVLNGSLVHLFWHSNHEGRYDIFAARFSTSLIQSGSTVKLTAASTGSRFPKASYLSTTNRVMVAYERTNSADVVAAGSQTPTSEVYLSLYSLSTNSWDIPSVRINAGAGLYARPSISKRVSGSPIVTCDVLKSTTGEGVDFSTFFSDVAAIAYTVASGSTFTTTASTYTTLSGVLPRKEIAIGDISGRYGVDVTISRLAVYCGDALPPYKVGIVSSGNSPVTDDRSFDALVNNRGDAWLATQQGLAFYSRGLSKLVLPQSSLVKGRPFRAMAIDDDGVLYASTGSSILSSPNHIDFAAGIDAGSAVSDLHWANGRLWAATDNGVVRYRKNASGALSLDRSFGVSDGLGSALCACVASDDAGVWIGTISGLSKVDSSDRVTTYTASSSGLPSDAITAIAPAGGNRRYIASAGGVARMDGERFRRVAIDDETWSNNIRSVLFQAPGTLWIGTLSRICQVQIDDDGIEHVLNYNIADYAPNAKAYDDLRTYYSLHPNAPTDCIVEIRVNGRRVEQGIVISRDNRIVRFDVPLRATDIVEFVYRNDLTLHTSYRRTKARKSVEGGSDFSVRKLRTSRYKPKDQDSRTEVFALLNVDGTGAVLRHDNIRPTIPFGEIALDTEPPTGKLSIVRQVDRRTLQVSISEVEDNLSGVAKMVVSGLPNFTSDGVNPIEPVDFSNDAYVTLNDSLESLFTIHDFTTGEKGNKIARCRLSGDNDTMFVGTRNGASLYRWNPTLVQFQKVITFDTSTSASIDFITVFNSVMIVGIGKEGGSTQIRISTNGETFELLGTISAPHVYAHCTLNGLLWLGDSLGRIYSYGGSADNAPLRLRINTSQAAIYSMVGMAAGIYCATGDRGNLVLYNPSTDQVSVVYTDLDANLTAVDALIASSADGTGSSLFVGTGSRGTVLSGNADGAFDTSFRYSPSRVTSIKIDDAAMRFAIGPRIWEATAVPTFSGWKPLAALNEDVRSFEPSDTSGDLTTIDLWVVTDNHIQIVRQPSDSKRVYLQLIDNAGNKSATGEIFDAIAIADLLGYVHANRVIEIDPSGEVVKRIDGSEPFYSAKRVEVETGEYLSDVFFGGNSLLAWDLLTFECETPEDTEVTISLRAADSRDALLAAPWQATFASNFKTGVGLTFLHGKYVQFKAVLSTSAVGVTPRLTGVTIRARSAAATHFFTTNFFLGSRVKSGLVTANTIVPKSSEIVVGINTNNSVDFNDYQIVEPDRIFIADESQTGTSLRIGFRLVAPTPGTYATDTFGSTGTGGFPLNVNTVSFGHAPSGLRHYRVSFYSDSAMADLVYVASSYDDVAGWTADGTPLTEDGVTASATQRTVVYAPPADSSLVCNTDYHVKIEEYNLAGDAYTTIAAHQEFISGCNTSFVDEVEFPFTAPANGTYNFRVRVYKDAARTDLFKVFFSTTRRNLFEVDGVAMPLGGAVMTSGQSKTITVTPPANELAGDTVYHLIVDSFNGTTFGTPLTSWTFRLSDPISGATCGDAENVPVIKNFGVRFTLEDGRVVTLNL